MVVILLIWWLLRAQTSQVEDVHVHDDEHHDDHAPEEPAVEEMAAEAAAEEMEVPVADAPEAVPSEPDDLKKLEGVGPKVEEVLNAAGIATFAQLAAADVDHLQSVLDAAEYQYMNPGSWPEQARLAAAGEWDALQKLQDELSGGK